MANSEYNLTVVDGTALTISLSGPVGPAGATGPAGASGSVSNVSVTPANGISGNVTNPTTTPAITLSLGAITPTSVNGLTITGTGTLTATGPASVSGTNTGDNATNTQYSGLVTNATHTGDVTGSGLLTLATVNSNTGSIGSATQSLTVNVNGKGLVTAVSAQTVTPAVGNITGLGTGVSTFLATPTLANLNTAVSDADVAKVDGQTHTGEHQFSSTTRPTSSGTGTPAATSLLKRDDVDRRYLSALRSINMDLWSLWTSTLTTGGSISANVGYLGLNGGNGTAAGAALAKFDGARNFCGVAPTGSFTGIDFANKVNCNFAFVTRSWADFTSLNWAFIFGECETATFTGIADRIKTGTGSGTGWVGLRCVAGSVTIVAVNGTSTVRESAQIDTCLNSTVNTKGYRMEISGGIITVFNSLGIVIGTLGTGASDGAPTTSKGFGTQAMVQSSVTTSQIGIIIQHISFDW